MTIAIVQLIAKSDNPIDGLFQGIANGVIIAFVGALSSLQRFLA